MYYTNTNTFNVYIVQDKVDSSKFIHTIIRSVHVASWLLFDIFKDILIKKYKNIILLLLIIMNLLTGSEGYYIATFRSCCQLTNYFCTRMGLIHFSNISYSPRSSVGQVLTFILSVHNILCNIQLKLSYFFYKYVNVLNVWKITLFLVRILYAIVIPCLICILALHNPFLMNTVTFKLAVHVFYYVFYGIKYCSYFSEVNEELLEYRAFDGSKSVASIMMPTDAVDREAIGKGTGIDTKDSVSESDQIGDDLVLSMCSFF